MKKIFAGIGSRRCPLEICELMHNIAYKFAALGWIFRSGGAIRSDTAFQNGTQDFCKDNDILFRERQEIYLPWDDFNGLRINPDNGIYWIDPASNPKIESLARIFHPKFNDLGVGAKKLIMRNGHQILGKSLISPAHMVICWTKDGSIGKVTTKHTGGTGHALRIAYNCKIPIYNLANKTTELLFRDWVADKNNNEPF